MSDWKTILGFTGRKGVQVEVNGKSVSFYPISGMLLFKVKNVAEPLAKLLMELFNRDQDNCTIEKSHTVEDAYIHEKVVEAISADLASVRFQERSKLVELLIQGVFGNEIRDLFAEACMDSMRDLFKRSEKGDPMNRPTPEEFFASVPADHLYEMGAGLYEANKGIFGPFVKNLGGVMSRLWQKVEGSTLPNTDEQNDPESLNLKTTGTDSNMSTSGQPDTED